MANNEQTSSVMQDSGDIELPRLSCDPAVASSTVPRGPATLRAAYGVGRSMYEYPQPGINADQTMAAVMSDTRSMAATARATAGTWWFNKSQGMFCKPLIEEASIAVVSPHPCPSSAPPRLDAAWLT